MRRTDLFIILLGFRVFNGIYDFMTKYSIASLLDTVKQSERISGCSNRLCLRIKFNLDTNQIINIVSKNCNV